MTEFHQQHQKVHTQINIGSITLNLHTTENIAGMMEKAVRLIHSGHYDQALILLDKVLLNEEEVADAYYYHGLAMLKGRRPRSTLKSSADKITQDLFTAIKLDPKQAHYYYLLALVLYDFFIMNGFSVRQDVESLLMEAEKYPVDKSKSEELLQHTGFPNSPIADFLKQRL